MPPVAFVITNVLLWFGCPYMGEAARYWVKSTVQLFAGGLFAPAYVMQAVRLYRQKTAQEISTIFNALGMTALLIMQSLFVNFYYLGIKTFLGIMITNAMSIGTMAVVVGMTMYYRAYPGGADGDEQPATGARPFTDVYPAADEHRYESVAEHTPLPPLGLPERGSADHAV